MLLACLPLWQSALRSLRCAIDWLGPKRTEASARQEGLSADGLPMRTIFQVAAVVGSLSHWRKRLGRGFLLLQNGAQAHGSTQLESVRHGRFLSALRPARARAGKPRHSPIQYSGSRWRAWGAPGGHEERALDWTSIGLAAGPD